jgi:hypothetical protein
MMLILGLIAHAATQQKPAQPQAQQGGGLAQLLTALATQNQQQKPAQGPKGNPRMQGRHGGSAGKVMRKSPNQGGYGGPGPSETTAPGMAHLAMLLGGGPPVAGLGSYGGGGLGTLPAAPK